MYENIDLKYKEKYLKYKDKYFNLKNNLQLGGAPQRSRNNTPPRTRNTAQPVVQEETVTIILNVNDSIINNRTRIIYKILSLNFKSNPITLTLMPQNKNNKGSELIVASLLSQQYSYVINNPNNPYYLTLKSQQIITRNDESAIHITCYHRLRIF